MRIEFNSFTVLFFVVLAFIGLYSPILGLIEQRKRNKETVGNGKTKSRFYLEQILWSWIPVAVILLSLALAGKSLKDIGFRQINLGGSSLKPWIVYPSIVLAVAYFLYNVYCILMLRFSRACRKQAALKLPQEFLHFFPITHKEKKLWTYVAITAGVTEEITYRGYLFCALTVLFPRFSVLVILLITTLIFGLGHIYQGAEAIKPTLLGLLYGFLFIVFDSILPIILIHITQDLVVRDLIDEDLLEEPIISA